MSIGSILKKVSIVAAVVTIGVIAFLIHALGGLGARPVAFADPPPFVEQYASDMHHSDHLSPPRGLETGSEQVAESEFAQLTADLSNEEVFVFNVIMNGTSTDMLLHLFAHPEKAQRVKVASAFAAVNVKYSHNEESGYPEKRVQFWVDVEEHLPDIQNALSEALIASAEDGTTSYIPYTLAWMPGQGHETVELLAWAAKHHPDPWVRRFSVYFVVRFGGDEEIAGPLLRDRAHDPDYRVRKEVLDRRYSRFKKSMGMGDNA